MAGHVPLQGVILHLIFFRHCFNGPFLSARSSNMQI
jgi:hypothetical protein